MSMVPIPPEVLRAVLEAMHRCKLNKLVLRQDEEGSEQEDESKESHEAQVKEDVSKELLRLFLGMEYSATLAKSQLACGIAHGRLMPFCLMTDGFKEMVVHPGKPFPVKCYIQHSQSNVNALKKLVREKCSEYPPLLSARLLCVDSYGREYATPEIAAQEVKKDYACLETRK